MKRPVNVICQGSLSLSDPFAQSFIDGHAINALFASHCTEIVAWASEGSASAEDRAPFFKAITDTEGGMLSLAAVYQPDESRPDYWQRIIVRAQGGFYGADLFESSSANTWVRAPQEIADCLAEKLLDTDPNPDNRFASLDGIARFLGFKVLLPASADAAPDSIVSRVDLDPQPEFPTVINGTFILRGPKGVC